MTPTPSPNFAYLAHHDARLVALATQAEEHFASDPTITLFKLRQFGEVLAKRAAAKVGVLVAPEETQVDLIRRLFDRQAIGAVQKNLFHDLRRAGNSAVHEGAGDHREALHQIKMARELGIWFQRSFGNNRKFDPGPFVPPSEPKKHDAALHEELERLRAVATDGAKEVEAAKTAIEDARKAAEREAAQRLTADERAAKAAEDAAIWQALANEEIDAKGQAVKQHAAVQAALEAQNIQLLAELAALQAAAQAAPPAQREAVVTRAAEASAEIALDEAATRRIIDKQLREVGWEVDSDERTHARGVRPQAGKAVAIAEWPTDKGPADYVLFLGLDAVAVVEAKRSSKDIAGSIEQAKRYARAIDVTPIEGGPWNAYKVPFLFATNGRPYLRQLATKSGIHFLDARRKENHARALDGWPSPDGLKGLLAQDIDAADAALRVEPTQYLGLRDYQLRAIRAVEEAIARGQRQLLVAMATGTGKTKTCIGLLYRLLKTKRFRRILFLVDRTALAEQAENAFEDTRLENLQMFTDIFDLKGIGDAKPDKDTKVHVATIQGMVARVVTGDDGVPPPVDSYDCIVIDECHRGYLLDRELGELELTFRDENDYISKYRRVLDHFDAVKIGLTATPALHTSEIFGVPVFRYPYREAVIDGFLVDHEPPLRIVTELAADGMTWKAGEEMTTVDAATGVIDTVMLPDEVNLDIDSYNRRVITESFNRVVCERLAKHIDPRLPEKTIIFCANDDHADMVVMLLKKAFDAEYGGIDDDLVVKITGAADKPRQLIRRLRNEHAPTVAVSVDLLTTGVDIPKVFNIVFLRRVKSRILYDQMLGRATRLCPELQKETFKVFDAVDLYADLSKLSDMRPVVVEPKVTFEQLAREMAAQTETGVRELLLDQLLAKLQGKQRRMSDDARERFREITGHDPKGLVAKLKADGAHAAAAWLAKTPALTTLLDSKTSGGYSLIVSEHADTLREETHGYGKGQRPEDYLDAFAKFLREKMNEIPALVVVTQRPRELTRAQLKELRLALDAAGYTDAFLRTAWRDKTNADIAASIIGFVRQAALGDALVPYAERVDYAMKKLLASRAWDPSQRKWLDRIGKQMKLETIVDRTSIDEGEFKAQVGGFERLNKQFEGKLEEILGELRASAWERVG